MTEVQGQFGRVKAFEDFVGPQGDVTWGTGEVDLGNGWGIVSVNEGTMNKIVDEPNGVLQFLTDTADNDNVCLLSGPYKPSNGAVVMEARFKISDSISLGAIFAGFSETMALDTPVMPAEYATATLTINGTGGMAGLLWDPDGTADNWRALAADGGAISSGVTAGGDVDTGYDMVLDEYEIVRVVIGASGTVEIYHGNTASPGNRMHLVAKYTTALTPTDLFYAVLMLENRSGAAEQLEVDYVEVENGRDWDTTLP